MSLLYECINGIIQGGILGEADDISGREEIASLCVTKLRGMIAGSSDPNCKIPKCTLPKIDLTYGTVKYVALLAFNRIVVTHPFLVAEQEDVILECIDSEDITIRIKALDLVQGMVSSDNLVSIVSRLMRQLKSSSSTSNNQRNGTPPMEPGTDSEEEAAARNTPQSTPDTPPLPEEYMIDIMRRILDMCSQNNYSSLVDFDWYVDVLTQLVRLAPLPRKGEADTDESIHMSRSSPMDISEKIGNEVRNIAIKVKAIRHAAIRATQSIILQLSVDSASYPVVSGTLRPIAWIAGEFAAQLSSAEDTLGCLLQLIPRILNPEALASCIQAIIKIFSFIAGDDLALWTPERKSRISLLMARIIHTLEPFTMHPYLEAQERAVEFIELMKLTAEAASGQASTSEEMQQDAPLLLTQAIPSLFHGWELNSVAPGAQRNVPIPEGLDLDEPIHPNLTSLLAQADSLMLPMTDDDEFEVYYNQKPQPTSITNEPAISRIADGPEEVTSSYQQVGESTYLDPDIVARRKAERLERNRDDPFYIGGDSGRSGGSSTPIHNILKKENGPDLDIDSIPIMQLNLDNVNMGLQDTGSKRAARPSPRQRIVVAADETLFGSGLSSPRNYESENNSASGPAKVKSKKGKQSLLQVNSTHLNSLSINDSNTASHAFDYERQEREEAEMAQAVKEVERLRLEMQRANERIQVAQGVPVEGTVVKKKKAKKPKVEDGGDGEVKTKKKKAKKPVVADEGEGSPAAVSSPVPDAGAVGVVKAKKKKSKRIVQLDGDEVAAEVAS
jgi:AP-3 complex subunit delta-1